MAEPVTTIISVDIAKIALAVTRIEKILNELNGDEAAAVLDCLEVGFNDAD